MNNNVKRILAAFIDFIVILFLSSFSVCIVTLGKMNTTPLSISSYFISYVLLLIIKDFIFKNASIGKRIFKIKVVKIDGTRLTLFDVLKRTLPLILLPIELILMIINDKRMGDIWAKTLVIEK